MRKLLIIAALAACALPAFAGDHPEHPQKAHPMGTESGWFDFENCIFCKHLMDDPGLLPHTTWTNHKIANGSMNITTVAPEYRASMEKAMKYMQQAGADMQSGKINPMEAEMCGHCQEYGALMMAGAKVESVDTPEAMVTLMTSDDPALVARIHKAVDRTNAEMEQMMASQGGDHPGHH